jgi:uncharacterized protein YggU (UPF0235/DUF167 family)
MSQFFFHFHPNERNDGVTRSQEGYKRLNVTVSAVRIVAGKKSRTKRVSIAGVTRAQAMRALDL